MLDINTTDEQWQRLKEIKRGLGCAFGLLVGALLIFRLWRPWMLDVLLSGLKYGAWLVLAILLIGLLFLLWKKLKFAGILGLTIVLLIFPFGRVWILRNLTPPLGVIIIVALLGLFLHWVMTDRVWRGLGIVVFLMLFIFWPPPGRQGRINRDSSRIETFNFTSDCKIQLPCTWEVSLIQVRPWKSFWGVGAVLDIDVCNRTDRESVLKEFEVTYTPDTGVSIPFIPMTISLGPGFCEPYSLRSKVLGELVSFSSSSGALLIRQDENSREQAIALPDCQASTKAQIEEILQRVVPTEEPIDGESIRVVLPGNFVPENTWVKATQARERQDVIIRAVGTPLMVQLAKKEQRHADIVIPLSLEGLKRSTSTSVGYGQLILVKEFIKQGWKIVDQDGTYYTPSSEDFVAAGQNAVAYELLAFVKSQNKQRIMRLPLYEAGVGERILKQLSADMPGVENRLMIRRIQLEKGESLYLAINSPPYNTGLQGFHTLELTFEPR